MRGLCQTRDDRVDAGLNATLDLCTIFVPGLSTPGIEVITKAKCGAAGTTVPPATVGLCTEYIFHNKQMQWWDSTFATEIKKSIILTTEVFDTITRTFTRTDNRMKEVAY